MIRIDVSKSKKIASLSSESLALFFLLIPHINSHGKMKGDVHFIKGEACPLVKWLTLEKIETCMREISEKTNLKWFVADELKYIHSLNWEEHQDLREERMGEDCLPSYSFQDNSMSSPGVVLLEGKGKVEGKDKYTSPSGSVDSVLFSSFWLKYPHRNGRRLNKQGTKKIFEKLSPLDQIGAARAAENFANSKQAKDGYGIKDPERFLQCGKKGEKIEPWRDWLEPETIQEPNFPGKHYVA